MERKRIENTESHVSSLGDQLKSRIIGQDHAVDSVISAMEKARLREEGRPVASLMFLGVTGTGKTETAEVLADIMAIDKLHPNIVKVDGGQFAQSHETAALLGAPPGYVGREQKPVLDPNILEMPGSVLLFDEIEKAHPKVHNLLLQIMDKGTVTLLNSGQEVNFSNCTVIMTSNVGAREMQDTVKNNRIGFSQDAPVEDSKVEAAGMAALKKQFSPEFINRLDGVITFNSLSDEQLAEVLDTHVEKSNHRYRRLGDFTLSLTQSLKSHLVETAEDRKEYGFRPVKRNYERSVESALGRFVGTMRIGGNEIEADYEEDEVTFYEGAPIHGSTIEEILGMSEEDFFEPECEDDELMLPANITPIKKRKK